jgi:hypothetical protein
MEELKEYLKELTDQGVIDYPTREHIMYLVRKAIVDSNLKTLKNKI